MTMTRPRAAAAIISGAVERAATHAAKAAEQRDNKNNKNDCSYRHVAISSSPAVGTVLLPSDLKQMGA